MGIVTRNQIVHNYSPDDSFTPELFKRCLNCLPLIEQLLRGLLPQHPDDLFAAVTAAYRFVEETTTEDAVTFKTTRDGLKINLNHETVIVVEFVVMEQRDAEFIEPPDSTIDVYLISSLVRHYDWIYESNQERENRSHRVRFWFYGDTLMTAEYRLFTRTTEEYALYTKFGQMVVECVTAMNKPKEEKSNE